MPGAAWIELTLFNQLYDLELISNQITDADMQNFAKTQAIASIKSHGAQEITNAGYKQLGALTNLEALDLTFTNANDAALKELAVLDHLRELNLKFTISAMRD